MGAHRQASGILGWAAAAVLAAACQARPSLRPRVPVAAPTTPAPAPPQPAARPDDWSGPAEDAIFERVAEFRRRLARSEPVAHIPADPVALQARLVLDPADVPARRALLKHYVLAGDGPRTRSQAAELCRHAAGSPTLVFDLLSAFRFVPDAFAGAADVLRSESARRHGSDAVLFNCGRVLALHGPPTPGDSGDEALFYLQRCVRLAPGRALYRETLADRLRAAGFLGEAREAYRAAADLWKVGDRGEAYLGIAEISTLIGDDAGARSAAQVALADNGVGHEPGAHVTNRAHVLLGLLALREQRLRVAAGHLGAAADIQPCAHTAADGLDLRLAEALALRGRADLARRYARIAILFNPSDPAATSLLHRTAPRS